MGQPLKGLLRFPTPVGFVTTHGFHTNEFTSVVTFGKNALQDVCVLP